MMDEIYIKMCDCPEVQEQKEGFDDGDWFACWEAGYPAGTKGDLIVGVIGTTWYEFTREDAIKNKHLDTVGFDEGDEELIWEGKVVWLPRQDQIQEMMGDGTQVLINNFSDFCLKEKYESHISHPTVAYFNTLEQLWLAFYMMEVHDKVWDGKKWVTK